LVELNAFAEIVRTLSAKHGVYAVTGNHEFYAGVQHFFEFCRTAKVRILANEHVTLAGELQLAGVHDHRGSMLQAMRPDLDAALQGADPNKPTILLSHQPLDFKKAVRIGVGLQLSGHTHAGQIPPMDLIVKFYYDYPWGLYRHQDSYIYTTCGTGTWSPPMRLLSRNEIVAITLCCT
jgi:predicted MPP superfamily phosphohydrolase